MRIQSRICGGGPALHSILLSEGLSEARGSRYDTTLLGGALEPGESSMEEFARARGVQVELLSQMRRAVNPLADARAVAATVQRLRELRPTIVHTHTAKAGAVGRTAAALVRTPVVLHTFHGHVFDGYFSPRKAQAFLAAERALARVTDRILALSEQQRRDLAFKYRVAPIEKIQVVPLGLELDRFSAVRATRSGPVRRALGIGPDAKVIAAAGRFVPIKRFDLLIQAFAKVLGAHPDAHLLLAGDGASEDRAALERQAEALGGRVHFLGWRKDLEAIFAEADLLALSSDNEGTPVTVIEALAAGLPVVATRVGGVEDVVRGAAGTLVAPGDVGALAQAMTDRLHLTGDDARVPDGEREAVARRFSHRRLIADIEALYDVLVDEKLRRGALFARPRPKDAMPC
ncbi:MAG: glycosyltransferase [Myxococcales bacterium]|nr:glycosyltransferase [Myxococcales bacterium]